VASRSSPAATGTKQAITAGRTTSTANTTSVPTEAARAAVECTRLLPSGTPPSVCQRGGVVVCAVLLDLASAALVQVLC
jgi:hypothetical protein